MKAVFGSDSFRIFIVVLAFGLFAFSYNFHFKGDVQQDFLSYYYAGKVLAGGGNIYDYSELEVLNDAGRTVFPYLYTPVLAEVMVPISSMNLHDAQFVWAMVNIFSISFVFILLIRFLDKSGIELTISRLLFFFLLFLIFAWNIKFNIKYGQVNLFVLLLILISLTMSEGDSRLKGGLILGFAVIIKMTPAILIFYYLVRKNYRAVAGAIVGIVVVWILSIAFFGFSAWNDFFVFLRSPGFFAEGLNPLNSGLNYSFAGIISRYAGAGPDSSIILSIACSIILLAFSFIIALKLRNKRKLQIMLLPFSIIMILISPYAYCHHVVWLLPGFAVFTVYLLLLNSFIHRLRIIALSVLLVLAASVDLYGLSIFWGGNYFLAGYSGLIGFISLALLMIISFILALRSIPKPSGKETII